MTKKSKKPYVLIPVMPTPNGPLHLGHIAGPFLRMDILARHLRRRGETVSIVSATDPYETHVLPKAESTSKSIEEVCHENYELIRKCLETMNIRYDKFINPLDKAYRERLSSITKDVLEDLRKQGLVKSLEEQFFTSRNGQKIVEGSWIEGECPACGTEMGGFHCERCAMEVSPIDLVNAKPAFTTETEMTEAVGNSAFMEAGKNIKQYLNEARVSPEIALLVDKFLESSGNLIRLSNHGFWGDPWIGKDASAPSVVFTYSALFMLSVLCAEDAQYHLRLTSNPLDKDSDVNVITSFGFDNSIPYCASVASIAEHSSRYRNFDRYLINYFYTLDGSKFSTSRNHSIWAHEALDVLETNSDILRYYLAETNPEHSVTDFDTRDFKKFNKKFEILFTKLEKAASEINTKPVMDLDIERKALMSLTLNVQNSALDPDKFVLKTAARMLGVWISATESKPVDFWTIYGFCILAYPIMPEISARLWKQINQDGLPNLAENYALIEEAA